MTDTGTGRRFLVSVGVSTYRDSSITPLPGAAADAERVAGLLEPMGYVRVLPDLSVNPSHTELAEGLDEWAYETELGPEDTVVVYFAGHGRKEGHEHFLLCSNHRPGRWSTAVRSDDLAKPLVRSQVGHLLVILDTCFASAGTESVATLATQLTHTRRGSAQRAMIAAARGKETAKENKFVDALTQVLATPRTGPSQRYLSVREVTARVNEHLDSPHQHASHSVIDSAGQDPFFDNVLYIPTADQNGLDLAVLAQLRKRHEGHYGPRGKGLEHAGERGDYFTGRTSVLGSLSDWLRGPHDRKARVVTGDPGSGKSAVLGRLLDLSDPQHLARSTATEAAWLPPAGLEIVRLWARRASGTDLVRDLGAAVSLPDTDLTQLLKELGSRTDEVVIVIDSLDEAGTAGDQTEGRRIARELLQPLSAMSAVRLIVGTRRDLIPALGQAVDVLDLDTDEHAREAVTDYARALLLDAHDPDSRSPYRHAPDLANEVALGIAAQAGRSFLVARMNARALVHRQQVVDTSEDGWELSLPSDAKQAFADYLERFGAQRQRVVRLLRPLAYAQGAGLPWSTIWAPLAEALSGTPCSNDDLEWLFEIAGSYITEEESDGASVFRLYHETMAEYLRVPSSSVDHQRAIAGELSTLVPRHPATGERDWASVHPYVLTHLASHAVAGGILDGLLTDTEYVVHADPVTLLRALDVATGPDAEKFAAVYRTSAHLLSTASARARRDILSIDAARYRRPDLAEQLSQGRSWKVAWATGGLVHPAHRRTLAYDLDAPHVLSFTADGHDYAVTGGNESCALRQWDLRTGECVRAFGGGEDRPEILHKLMVDDRPHALIVNQGLQLWDLLTGECAYSIDGPATLVMEICGVVIDDRPHALTSDEGEDASVQVWDLVSGEHVRTLLGHTGMITSVAAVTFEGRPHALTGSSDESIRLWDLLDGTCVRIFGEQKHEVSVVHGIFIDDRPHVLAGDATGTMRLWDLQTGACVRSFVGHTHEVAGVDTLTINGRPHVLSVGGDETVRLWDLESGVCAQTLAGHTDYIQVVCGVTVNGQPHALTASVDESVRLWSLDGSHATTTSPWHTNWVVGVAATSLSNRPHAVTVSLDHSTRLWDVSSGDCVRVLSQDLQAVRGIDSFTIDGRPHALTAENRFVRLWDLQTGECKRTLAADKAYPYIQSVDALEMDGRPHALAGSVNALYLWDLHTGEQRFLIRHNGAIQAISSVRINDDLYALTGDHRGALRLWDLRTAECAATLTEQGTRARSVCVVTLNDRPHAVVSHRSTVHLWDLQSRNRTHLLSGHTGEVKTVSPLTLDDHPHLLTAAEDATARIWDLQTGECTEVISLPLPTTAATAVGTDLLICFANDMALFRRTKNHWPRTQAT
ncbi:caspase family protein [Streptomyces sp. NPDC048420]|uniref:caspase family protein n=1 Tax=Streptomyces sp. NPDC048420 TaxID=3155755 RepID=UPI00342A45F0